VYSILPPLPAVGGNEGVGVVDAIGAHVDQLKVGDWVIPAKPGFGTWRTHAVCNQSDVDVIHSDIPHWVIYYHHIICHIILSHIMVFMR
jgi:trans-2-enoyl-CoA reductase